MLYDTLSDTYATERIKTLSIWSTFRDDDLALRPHPIDHRGRSVLEHMVHQCVSENLWFKGMLSIDVDAPPLPQTETVEGFLHRYAEDSGRRLEQLHLRSDAWWREEVDFFEVRRTRVWIMVRRIAHTSHHRGQLTTMLRMLARDLHSTYGPTADTGGLMQHRAPTLYAYPTLDALLEDAGDGGGKAGLPPPGEDPVTERPGA